MARDRSGAITTSDRKEKNNENKEYVKEAKKYDWEHETNNLLVSKDEIKNNNDSKVTLYVYKWPDFKHHLKDEDPTPENLMELSKSIRSELGNQEDRDKAAKKRKSTKRKSTKRKSKKKKSTKRKSKKKKSKRRKSRR
tara:strand:+ start:1140 stop:1553 length:414 start_codon:yes stop_codon:yes gene_type:complete